MRPKPGEYVPPQDMLDCFPDISGNTVNGVGETVRRRPTPIYWHDPAILAHGDLQQWMIERFVVDPDFKDIHDSHGGRGSNKPAPVAAQPVEAAADEHAAAARAFALANEADLFGVARIDPLWVFEGYEVGEPWAIILGVEMDYDKIATAPATECMIEVMAQYNRGTRAARAVAAWVRGRGYAARPHGGPVAGPMTLIPAALACGFGELGKNGSILNRRYGGSFRLASVLTDMPLVATGEDRFGADDFCSSCRLCDVHCPMGAISPEKKMVRGVEKWSVDFDKCVPFFNETYGCGICIAVCPWSRSGVAPRLAEKMSRRARSSHR